MPELPDLTVFAENLDKIVSGKRIKGVTCHRERNLDVAPREVVAALAERRIAAVERWGKELLFRIDSGRLLFIHLMLTGGFSRNGSAPAPILSIAFDDGVTLVLNDPKGWAKISLNHGREEAAPDALEVTVDYLNQVFARKPRLLAKAFLIDQQLLRGIGNAYADEILWTARISPRSQVGKIPLQAVKQLAETIPSVLLKATEQLRASHPGIIGGEVRDFLAVHNPSRAVSPTGRPIQREEVASKTTYFTDEQELYR